MGDRSPLRTDGGRDEPEPSQEEQVETEWHFWLIGALLVGGFVVVIVRPGNWVWLGVLFIAIAVIGWLLKTYLEWSVS